MVKGKPKIVIKSLCSQPSQPEYSGNPLILANFSALLKQSLEKAGRCITSELKKEFKDLGDRINTIETKLDSIVAGTN